MSRKGGDNHGYPRLMSRLTWKAIVITITAGVALIGGRRFITADEVAPPSLISVGAHKTALSSWIDFSKARVTVVLAINSDCQYCMFSMPSYRRVFEQWSRSMSVQFAIVGTEPKQTLESFVAEYQIHPDSVFSMKATDLRFAVTPTIALMDEDGRVRGVWAGEQSSARLSLIGSEIARIEGEGVHGSR